MPYAAAVIRPDMSRRGSVEWGALHGKRLSTRATVATAGTETDFLTTLRTETIQLSRLHTIKDTIRWPPRHGTVYPSGGTASFRHGYAASC